MLNFFLFVPQSIQKACEELIERLKPLRLAMPDAEWAEITGAAYQQNINLSATYLSPVADHQGYDVCGIACTEVEIDILSGNILLSRVDILEDTGKSLSPFIDIGQVFTLICMCRLTRFVYQATIFISEMC